MKRSAQKARSPGGNVPCPDCGAVLRVARQPHRYTIHPKWAITIADAEVSHCDKCGYFEVAIPKPDALHRTISAAVIRKSALLSGPELAFLRSVLRMTGRALAKSLGVVQESVSRWENDALPVSPPIDHLLRAMVALTLDGEKFPVETFAQIEGQAGPMKLVVRVDERGLWRRAA
jgi:putative zinc finger/helix-turn-helix YgiT family protein